MNKKLNIKNMVLMTLLSSVSNIKAEFRDKIGNGIDYLGNHLVIDATYNFGESTLFGCIGKNNYFGVFWNSPFDYIWNGVQFMFTPGFLVGYNFKTLQRKDQSKSCFRLGVPLASLKYFLDENISFNMKAGINTGNYGDMQDWSSLGLFITSGVSYNFEEGSIGLSWLCGKDIRSVKSDCSKLFSKKEINNSDTMHVDDDKVN